MSEVRCTTKGEAREAIAQIQDGDCVIFSGFVSGFGAGEEYPVRVPEGAHVTIKVFSPVTSIDVSGPGSATVELYANSSVRVRDGDHQLVCGRDEKVSVDVDSGAAATIRPEPGSRGTTTVKPGGHLTMLDDGIEHRRVFI